MVLADMSIAPSQVSVVLVTRGDVNMQPVIAFPKGCEIVSLSGV